jgi:hypothetical protein
MWGLSTAHRGTQQLTAPKALTGFLLFPFSFSQKKSKWIPACAGMTSGARMTGKGMREKE